MDMRLMSKGSKRRPSPLEQDEFNKRWNDAFKQITTEEIDNDRRDQKIRRAAEKTTSIR